MSSPERGLFDDWVYAASWDKSQNVSTKCDPVTYDLSEDGINF